MDHYSCYVLSRQLGRIAVQMHRDEKGVGSIRLQTAVDQARVLTLLFNIADVERLVGDGCTWEEFAVRLAITQAQKTGLEDLGCASTVGLNIDLRPWKGDLLQAHYGGATLGLEAHEEGARPGKRRVRQHGVLKELRQTLQGEPDKQGHPPSGVRARSRKAGAEDRNSPERRRNAYLARVVQDAIDMQMAMGKHRARTHLTRHAVPSHITSRILAAGVWRQK